MKTLFLVRHAKASKDDPELPDQERPLTERGENDAPKMGKRLAKRGVKPDLIVSSPAKRALVTAEAIARTLDYKPKDIMTNNELYVSEADNLLDIIHGFDDKLEDVMLVGHNPALDELAHRLSSKIDHLPTCAVVRLSFDTQSWSAVGTTKPAKVQLDYPKSA